MFECKVKELLKELNNYRLIIISHFINHSSWSYELNEIPDSIPDSILNSNVTAYTINLKNNVLIIYYE